METNSEPEDQAVGESLEELYEDAPCGYLSTLPDGTLIKVNRTFLAWTGYGREELLAGTRFQDLLPVVGKIFYETHYMPLLFMQGFAHEIAFELIGHDGQRLPVLVNSVQKRDPSGTPVVTRTTLFNAKDRREYERELQIARNKAEQALKLRDQFLSLASHELRTPLTSILGNIELLQRRLNKEHTLNARDQRTLQIIAGQAVRLNKMILSLLDISRIETGQLSIERMPVDIRALVKRVVDEVQTTLEAHAIEVQSPIQPIIIQGDDMRLEQVFQNLIQNALKYSPQAARILVVIRSDHAHAHIDIHDSGIGIPAAALPKLFERFYRAENIDSEHVSGMGIGLYVVKEIVELHGGTVSVASIEGEGSTFTVSLPLAATSPV